LFCNRRGCLLGDRILERLAGLENRQLRCGDLDGGLRAGVAAEARGAMADFKRAEADELER
jgi:hypothetical protein